MVSTFMRVLDLCMKKARFSVVMLTDEEREARVMSFAKV